jgi:hypothetical protein
MARCRQCRYPAIALFAALLAGVALAQERGDPVGALTAVASFDRAQRVSVGKSKAGKLACFFREQGDSHTLDIGIAADGAFIRLENFEPREATPAPPLRVFAGKQLTKGGYVTDTYTVLQAYDGPIDYFIPKPDSGGFVVVAKADAKAFLEMVARARTEFVVVQSVANPKNPDIVAIYDFKTAAIPALLACAKDRLR